MDSNDTASRGQPIANLDAERAVLGAMLLDPAGVAEVLGTGIVAADFYLPKHSITFDAIVATANGRGVSDPLAVGEELSRIGRLQDAGGHSQLLDYMEAVVCWQGVAAHAEIVRDKARQRRIAEVCAEVARRAYENENDADQLAELMKAATEIRGSRKAKTMKDIVDEMAAEGPRVHQPTGFPTLDLMTGGGLVFGDVHVWNGAPSACKTMVLAQLAHKIDEKGITVAIHCADERDHDLATRLFQRVGFQRSQIERREPEDIRRMTEEALCRWILFYDDELTVEQVFADLVRESEQLGQKSPGQRRRCLVIDSLQTVTSAAESRTASEHERLSVRLKVIRNLARKHRVLVLMTSEVGRNSYKSRNVAERTADLAAGKGSGSIEYYSRFLVNLDSVKGESDVIEMRVAKNKLGVGQIHRDGEPGIFLRVSRDEQTVVESQDYTPADKSSNADPLEANIVRVCQALHRLGSAQSRAVIYGEAKMKPANGVQAFETALHRQWIEDTGTQRKPCYRTTPLCVCVSPHTPRERGERDSHRGEREGTGTGTGTREGAA